MTARLATLWYWLGAGIAVALVAAAVVWNAWTFNQYTNAVRQLTVLKIDPSTAADSQAAGDGELALLLEADRRGILEDNFVALLTEPQRRALARARQDRLAARAGDRRTSLLFGVVLVVAGVAAFLAGRRARRRA